MERERALRARVDRLLTGKPIAPTRRVFGATADFASPGRVAAANVHAHAQRFNHFIPEDVEEASALASEMIQHVDTASDTVSGLDNAVSLAEQRADAGDRPGLAQHALKLFLTHDERARSFFPLEPLVLRQPRALIPSTTAKAGAAVPYSGTATPPEDELTWWREDPLLNEHHEHWHLVYPTAPLLDHPFGDRHGELFGYMHEQMLARYDAERLALGLDKVEPFDTSDYTKPIPQGYDPGPITLYGDDGNPYGYRARPAGASLSDLTLDRFAQRPGAKLANQKRFYDQSIAAGVTGKFVTGQPVDVDDLGNVEESNTKSIDYYGPGDKRNFKTLGNHHNDGHIHFMLFDNTVPFGVMADTTTAVRDPIFWRWHRHVDSVYHNFQERRGPYAWDDYVGAAFDDVPAVMHPFVTGTPPDAAVRAGKIAATDVGATTANLSTEMLTRTFDVDDEHGRPLAVEIRYVSHDDFYYAVPIRNLSAAPGNNQVALRIFIAPEQHVDDRQAWIEMDKLVVSLAPGEAAIVLRASDQASVVRKPALRPKDLTPTSGAGPSDSPTQDWCDCGWPYTMLVPRGTKDGMPFRLFAMLSPGSDITGPLADTSDPNHEGEACSSTSYCGIRDNKYPDARDMGYPFSRPFGPSFDDFVKQHATTMRTWPITITCKNP